MQLGNKIYRVAVPRFIDIAKEHACPREQQSGLQSSDLFTVSSGPKHFIASTSPGKAIG